MPTNTYSFLDVNAAIAGPGINVAIGNNDTGVAEEGIEVAMDDDKSSKTMGADGSGMHSLHASKGGTITLRLLKTSPLNGILSKAYDFQTLSSANHGQNTITIRNPVSGDSTTAAGCAFKRLPANRNAKDGGINEWVFDAIRVDMLLGSGAPAIVA